MNLSTKFNFVTNFDNIEQMIEEIKALPTYQIIEGGPLLVERHQIEEILAKHVEVKVTKKEG